MPTTYSILGQSAPTDTNNANLFSVTSGTQYVVSTIAVCNTTTSAATCRIFARLAGAAAATTNAIIYDSSIPANTTVSFTIGITLNGTAGDIITVRSGTANALTFTAFGSAIS
jgi:hypothetical protein